MLGFGVILTVFALAGTWLQWNARDEREAAQAGSKRLELAPPNAGALRVVATPWAEVNVDGQRIDVTPMARAIPLAAGTHYVTLTHPSAPPDKRVVVITAGETTTLEATMKLPAPGDKDAGAGAARVRRWIMKRFVMLLVVAAALLAPRGARAFSNRAPGRDARADRRARVRRSQARIRARGRQLARRRRRERDCPRHAPRDPRPRTTA